MFGRFLIFALVVILIIPPVFAENEAALKISNSLKDSIDPFVATDGTDIFVAWVDHSRSGPSEIFFSKSIDGGETFSNPQNISNKKGSSIMPSVATDGTNIFITLTYRFPDNYSGTWSDDNSEILFSKSTDGGATFSVPQKISDGKSFSSGSKIAIDGNNIFITWFTHFKDPDEIFFSNSIDGGATFSAPQNISNNESSSHHPSITTDGTNIFVTWSDDYMENPNIFFSKSTDGGATFSAPQNISNNIENSVGSFVATNGSDIFITWFEISKGSGEVLFSKSTDEGATFSAPQNISNNSGNSNSPSIATDGTNIFITWMDSQTKSSLILFSKSTDGGATFSPPQNISNNEGFSDGPSIATDGTSIFTTWRWAEGMYDHPEIFFSKSTIEQPSTKNDESLDDMMPQDESEQLDENNPTDTSETVPNYTVGTIEWLELSSVIGDYGILKIVDPDMNVNHDLVDIFTAKAWSETDPNGISLDMIESGKNTSEFFIDVEFTTESGIQKIKVSNEDIVTAAYQDATLPDESQKIDLIDTIEIIQKYLPPLKQLKAGIPIDEISCSDNQHKLFIKENAKPLCIKQATYKKLVQRGYF